MIDFCFDLRRRAFQLIFACAPNEIHPDDESEFGRLYQEFRARETRAS